MSALRERAGRVRLLVLDVDGVLTDGTLWFGPDGEALKTFNVRDGYGIRMLRRAGVDVAIISGRDSEAVNVRMRELGVEHVMQGVADKQVALDALLARLAVGADEVACLVDDLPDMPLLRTVGVPAAVADAHPVVRRAADLVTNATGGNGAVREVCEDLLSAQGLWEKVLTRYRGEETRTRPLSEKNIGDGGAD